MPVMSLLVMPLLIMLLASALFWIINIIMYYDVVITVEPKKRALREATATLNAANEKLQNVEALVAELEAKLAVLMAKYDEAMSDKEAVMAEAQRCQSKLDMATRLIGALGANGVIWESTVENIAKDLIYIPGDTLISCAFASYLGVFTRSYRTSCIEKFVQFLRKHNVELGPTPDPLSILTSEAEMAGWATQGLPSDRVSMENGAIMSNSERWCLMIDPQLQGIVWIKNSEVDNGLNITRMGHENMVKTFETCLDNGKPVMIENMGETIDAVLQPIIARNTIRRGSKQYIKVGDKEIMFSKGFKLYLQTKLSNPHYPPEIQAECTLINFTVTEAGLEDQLLFLVVKYERPDLARLKSDLISQQNNFKVKLAELETLLLEKLASAEGDILDDVDLILSLEDAKKSADEVKRNAVIARDAQVKVDQTSEYYRPVASRGSLLFFLLMDLAKMHSFYKFSLDSFVSICTRSMLSVSLRKKKDEGDEKAAGDDRSRAALELAAAAMEIEALLDVVMNKAGLPDELTNKIDDVDVLSLGVDAAEALVNVGKEPDAAEHRLSAAGHLEKLFGALHLGGASPDAATAVALEVAKACGAALRKDGEAISGRLAALKGDQASLAAALIVLLLMTLLCLTSIFFMQLLFL